MVRWISSFVDPPVDAESGEFVSLLPPLQCSDESSHISRKGLHGLEDKDVSDVVLQ